MEINNVFGVPAHPLLVHLPVVGIPVLALLALAMLARPAWRERMALPVAAVASVIAGATVLAASAGENLQERVPDTSLVRHHAELGDQTKAIVLVLAGLLIVYAAGRWLHLRERMPAGVARLLPVVLVAAAAVSVLATVWDVRTGHAGAKAAWAGTPAAASGHAGGD